MHEVHLNPNAKIQFGKEGLLKELTDMSRELDKS
jgi:hypothetical protein